MRIYLPGMPLLLAGLASLVVLLSAPGAALAAEPPVTSFLSHHTTISILASTIPANGDVNPYGVAVVHTSSGRLLQDPLGLTIAPNGNILTVNGNDGNIVETTPGGMQIAHQLLDNTVTPGTPPSPPGAGCLFGLAIIGKDAGVYFVDDCTNTLNTLK